VSLVSQLKSLAAALAPLFAGSVADNLLKVLTG